MDAGLEGGMEALAGALARPAATSLVVLSGDPGSGGDLLLAGALERLREQGRRFTVRRLDLDGYEADGDLAGWRRFRGDGDGGAAAPAAPTTWNAARLALGATATAAGSRSEWLELLLALQREELLVLEIADLPALPAPLLASLLEAASAPGLVLVAHGRAAEIRDRPLVRLPESTLFLEIAAPSRAELAARAGAEAWAQLRGHGAAPGERANLARFFALAGMCGPAIAADPLLDLLALFGEERQAFVDHLDQAGVDEGWLEDLEYSHPGFPHSLVYRFTRPLGSAIAREAVDPEDLASLGHVAFEFLSVLYARGGRSAHRLLLEMAVRLARPERKRLRRTLALWCAEGDAGELRAQLDASLTDLSLTAGELWETIEETAPLWTGARRLALLDAYGAAEGASEEHRAEIHAARAAALADLRRWPEAQAEARRVLAEPDAPAAHRSYVDAACQAVAGLAALADDEPAEEQLDAARRHLAAALESATVKERRSDPRLGQQVRDMAAFLAASEAATVRAALALLLATCRSWGGGAARGAADLWTRLGDLFRQAGKPSLARDALRRGLEIGRVFAAQPDAQLATLLKHLAEAELATENPAAAARAFEEALAIETQLYGKTSTAVEALENNLIDLSTRLGATADARRHLLSALAARRRKYGPAAPQTLVPAKLLADVCRTLGDREGAADALLAALEGEELLHGPGHPALIVLLKQLFDLYRELGQAEKALAVRQRLLGIEENHFGPDDPRLLPSLKMLAALHRGRGDEEAARLLASRARKIEASP